MNLVSDFQAVRRQQLGSKKQQNRAGATFQALQQYAQSARNMLSCPVVIRLLSWYIKEWEVLSLAAGINKADSAPAQWL